MEILCEILRGQGAAAGMTAHVAKPIVVAVLRAMLSRILN